MGAEYGDTEQVNEALEVPENFGRPRPADPEWAPEWAADPPQNDSPRQNRVPDADLNVRPPESPKPPEPPKPPESFPAPPDIDPGPEAEPQDTPPVEVTKPPQPLAEVIWADETEEAELPPGKQVILYEKTKAYVDQKVAAHVRAQVESVHKRIRNSQAGDEATRVLGRGQTDLPTIILADVATAVLEERAKNEAHVALRSGESQTREEKQYEQLMKNPQMVQRFIQEAQPAAGGALAAVRRVSHDDRARELEPKQETAFFEGLEPSVAEARACVEADKAAFQRDADEIPKWKVGHRIGHAVQRPTRLLSLEDQMAWEQNAVAKLVDDYNRARYTQRNNVKAVTIVQRHLEATWDRIQHAQEKHRPGETPDYLSPDAQVDRLKAFAAWSWPIIHNTSVTKGGGAVAADEKLYEVYKQIFDLRQQERERTNKARALDQGAYAAGNRPGMGREELQDRALLVVLEIQLKLAHGKSETPQKVAAEMMNELYGEEDRSKHIRYFFDNFQGLLEGGGPGMDPKKLQQMLEVSGLVWRWLDHENPMEAAEVLVDLGTKIQEGLRGEARYREMQEDPYAFLDRIEQSGLPWGEANDLLDLGDVTRGRNQFLEQVLQAKKGRVPPSPDEKALLYAFDKHRAALAADNTGEMRALLEKKLSDLSREQHDEQFNQQRGLLVNGPNVPADGSTGALLAFLISTGVLKGLDVFGNDTLGDQYSGDEWGETPINRLHGFVPGQRRYEMMFFEGGVPRGLPPHVLGQLRPGGVAAIQVRQTTIGEDDRVKRGMNETWASHVVRSIDPAGYEAKYPEEAKRQESSRSRNWPVGKIGGDKEGYLWAMVPSEICRWGIDPEGKADLAYGHANGDNTAKEWTLLVFRNKDMKGTPSDHYLALRMLAKNIQEQSAA